MKHFQQTPNNLTEVVKIIDEGIDMKTQWKPALGYYCFLGTSTNGDHYQIDIKTGKLMKNNSPISRISETILTS